MFSRVARPDARGECSFINDGGDIACPLGCAAPPTCIHAYCDAGKCKVNTSQDGSDCSHETQDVRLPIDKHETQDVRLPIDKAEVRHDRGRLSIDQGVFEKTSHSHWYKRNL